MTNITAKEKMLRKHKWLASSLFFLMVVLYIISVYLIKNFQLSWAHYLEAFSEAAMVGALADWFAVTALFKYPLGLKIPHTNIIQNSKNNIGANLGSFIVDNFINAKNIKPYLTRLTIMNSFYDFLEKQKNQEIIIDELKKILLGLVLKIDTETALRVLHNQSSKLINSFELNKSIHEAITYFIETEEYELLLEQLALNISEIVMDNEAMLKLKVKEQSHFLIPGFVNNKIAGKLTEGIATFLKDIAEHKEHQVRISIKDFLRQFAQDIATDKQWIDKIEHFKREFINGNTIQKYLNDLYNYGKKEIIQVLSDDNVTIHNYFSQMLSKNLNNWRNNVTFNNKIDLWIKKKLYYYILKNATIIGNLISTTVGNWDAKELSNKLEIEVGKDLQFIRINGTLVGGIVGLLIYIITQTFIA